MLLSAQDKMMSRFKKGDEIELRITSLAFGGAGVGRINDFVVFVHDALPGQKALVHLTKVKKSYAEGRVKELIEQSPAAVPPRCIHFGLCGGCVLQNLDYSVQLEEKSRQVKELLARIGGLDALNLLPPLPAPDLFYYRNKMEFSFARERLVTREELSRLSVAERSNGCFLGLHGRGFFHKVVDLEECLLMQPSAAEIVREIRKFARESGLPVHSTVDHQGFWRFVVIRSSFNTPDWMVNVITSEFREDVAEALKRRLMTAFPFITSLYNGVTRSKAAVAFCEETFLLEGKPYISETIGDLRFRISPNSFFQTNSRQVRHLYDVILQFGGFRGSERVYDLYCGAGSIALYISRHVREVIGIESVEAAVEDARLNALDNGINNCRFICSDLKDALENTEAVCAAWGQPDVVILDPPRGGMHPKTVAAVVRLAPQKIVHVSCNPATLARELAELTRCGYRVGRIQPVDMFPHTAHIEVVVELTKPSEGSE